MSLYLCSETVHTAMMLSKATTLCVFLMTFGFVWGDWPLNLGERVPNHSERDSSGAISGKIDRGSSRFDNELILNYNSDIDFKDEEHTGADRYMTPRCRDKLNKLARLVKSHWRGAVKLRVTEAWDEDNEHSSTSLHYEGRAVDITTSDVDWSKYGMLGRLAVDAGFDWVYYEAANHVHASVKKTTTSGNGGGGGGGGSGCFTLHSQVRTPAGDSLPINNLKVGDRIMTVKTSGEISDSPVISFMHYDTQKTSHFVQLQTDDDHTITLTPDHLIYKTNHKNMNATQLPEPVFASEVKEDDYLFVVPPDAANDTGTNIPTSRVAKVGVVQEKGVIAPLTADGTIVVDNVVASCYAVTRLERLAHLSFAPLRFLYHTVPGFLPGRVEGVPWYPSMLRRLAHLVGVIDSSHNIVTKEL